MADACSRFVERVGGAWVSAPWPLFAVWFLGPYFVPREAVAPLWLVCSALLLVWWFVDAVDQGVAAWQWAVGIAMLAIGVLPLGRLLLIAAWVIYWTRVRE